MKTPEMLVGCVCGAVPRNEKFPDGKVAVARWRRNQGWVVVCTRCGRVGERGSTQIDAKARWNAKRYKYGPLKEGEE